MKTIQVVNAYNILKSSKFSKVKDHDKLTIIKTLRSIRPIAEAYEKDKKDGLGVIQDENFKSLQEKALKHDVAVKNKDLDGILSESELKELRKFFEEANTCADKLIEELNNKEVDVSNEKLSEDSLSDLIKSNDFTCEDACILYDVLV